MALRIASSVACTVAYINGFIAPLGNIVTLVTFDAVALFGFAVEKATKMSPELFSPFPPMRPTPRPARVAIRRSWCGRSGASVATMIMMEPAPMSSSWTAGRRCVHLGRFGWTVGSAREIHGRRSWISSPTGTPATRSSRRAP
jgi:hypothetical protein